MRKDPKDPVAVVGAGIAGLTCALELQRAGVPVQVYEREASVGGRMRTRTDQGLAFDLGANFLVKAYPSIRDLADEMGVSLYNLSPVRHALYHQGEFQTMNFSSARDILRMDYLGLWGRLKFLEFVYGLRLRHRGLDFFHLDEVPDELNLEDAYSYARREVGQGFADYILDAFHTCMMFYRSSETSAGAFLALLQMKADPSFDFSIIHCAGEMQELPNAIARRLPVRASSPVLALEPCRQGWSVTTAGQGRETYRRLVLATTAGPALKMLRSGPDPHRTLLAGTRYSSTINLAFRLPCGTLGGTHCFYVPFVENQVVAEFTNESLKGRNAIAAGWSLVNVGLHESASRALFQAGDEEIFEVVAAELRKLHPGLEQAEPYDLVRWAEAIPKYSCQQVTAVKRFLREGQGAQGLYLCGDYMNSPWLEGASRSGRRVARQILEAE